MTGNATGNASSQSYAPCFVVNPGETIVTAMERHRRDTGYYGPVVLVAINRPRPKRVQALAA